MFLGCLHSWPLKSDLTSCLCKSCHVKGDRIICFTKVHHLHIDLVYVYLLGRTEIKKVVPHVDAVDTQPVDVMALSPSIVPDSLEPTSSPTVSADALRSDYQDKGNGAEGPAKQVKPGVAKKDVEAPAPTPTEADHPIKICFSNVPIKCWVLFSTALGCRQKPDNPVRG